MIFQPKNRFDTKADILQSFLFMMLLLTSFGEAKAQKKETTANEDTSVIINYIPKYSWSAGIEYSFLPSQISYSNWVPDNYEVQAWIADRWYWQAGAFAQYGNAAYDNYFFNYGFGIYAGATMKLFMFARVYFTPSWNIYYDQSPKDYEAPGWSLTTGPSATFEYFPWNRLSIRIDVLNFNYGYFFAKNPDDSGGKLTIHRGLGVGLRYNFNLGNPE